MPSVLQRLLGGALVGVTYGDEVWSWPTSNWGLQRMGNHREYFGIRFTGSKEPASQEMIAVFETQFRISLPSDYIAFLTLVNGGKPKPASFTYPGWKNSEWASPNYDLKFVVRMISRLPRW